MSTNWLEFIKALWSINGREGQDRMMANMLAYWPDPSPKLVKLTMAWNEDNSQRQRRMGNAYKLISCAASWAKCDRQEAMKIMARGAWLGHMSTFIRRQQRRVSQYQHSTHTQQCKELERMQVKERKRLQELLDFCSKGSKPQQLFLKFSKGE